MMKLVKRDQAISRKVTDNYTVLQMLTGKDSDKLSMVISKATDHREIALNTKSDRLYYILNGTVKVRSDGKEILAEKGDLVFLSSNTKYEFEGTFEAVQVMSPSFDPKNEPLDVNGNPKE